MWKVVQRDYKWSIFDNDIYIMGCNTFVDEATLLCELHNRSINDAI